MLGLLAAYGSDEESDSESGSEKEEAPAEPSSSKLPKPFELPTPKLEGDVAEKSVFINPYIQEDNKKTAALEKHVKMISTDVKTVNGKKICWNYRKSKCRFGHNCKFAHDSDLQTPVVNNEVAENRFNQAPLPERLEIVDEEEVRKGKKRPGLSQNIAPGQKVMKKYYSQKSK